VNTKGFSAAIAVANISVLLFLPLLSSQVARSPANFLSANATAAETWRFRLEEATIVDVHRAFRAKQLTATQLVNLYLNRIKAYNGTCVRALLILPQDCTSEISRRSQMPVSSTRSLL
jgi:hypothetical protein